MTCCASLQTTTEANPFERVEQDSNYVITSKITVDGPNLASLVSPASLAVPPETAKGRFKDLVLVTTSSLL